MAGMRDSLKTAHVALASTTYWYYYQHYHYNYHSYAAYLVLPCRDRIFDERDYKGTMGIGMGEEGGSVNFSISTHACRRHLSRTPEMDPTPSLFSKRLDY
jgi:hypothetical protein